MIWIQVYAHQRILTLIPLDVGFKCIFKYTWFKWIHWNSMDFNIHWMLDSRNPSKNSNTFTPLDVVWVTFWCQHTSYTYINIYLFIHFHKFPFANILLPHRGTKIQQHFAQLWPHFSKELLCGWSGQHKSGSVWVTMSAPGKTWQNALSVATLVLFFLQKVKAAREQRENLPVLWNPARFPLFLSKQTTFKICSQHFLNRCRNVKCKFHT